MTTATLAWPQRPGLVRRQSSTGSSAEAQKLERIVTNALDDLFVKPAWRGIDTLFQSLSELESECGTADWDGSNAIPVDKQSISEAYRFIVALPAPFSRPEISVEPDGEVELEWYRSAIRLFSVSIGPDGELTYAGRFGPESELHGCEKFHDEIPTSIIQALKRLFPES